MTTTTEADRLANTLAPLVRGDFPPMIMISAPSTVTHHDYQVGFFDDGSALIWARGEGLIAFGEGDRRTIEHLARCLGRFSAEQRAQMVGGADRWVDGIHWGSDGRWLGI